MKTHTVVVDFAQQFGIKEGLILTEFCRRIFVSGINEILFPVSEGKTFFPYMSLKQIRLSLQNLKCFGVILPVPSCKATLDRSKSYRIKEAVYQQFLKIIMAQEFPGREGFK